MKDIIKPPVHDSNFHLQYVFNHLLKNWEFKGYMCIKCERTVKSPTMLDRHANNCKKRNPKVYKVDPTPEYVKGLSGEPWKPLDFNQIKSFIEQSQDIKS